MRDRLIACALACSFALFGPIVGSVLIPPAMAQDTALPAGAAPATGLAAVIASHLDDIAKPSRRSAGPVIEAIGAEEGGAEFLTAWAERKLGQRQDGALFLFEKSGSDYLLRDPLTGVDAGTVPAADFTEIRPNSGVREVIGSGLVRFQLSDPDPAQRRAALTNLGRNAGPEHLEPLTASIAGESDPAIRAAKQRLEQLLTIRFGATPAARITAIEGFGTDLGLDFRAALNPILASSRRAFATPPEGNIARILTPGGNLPAEEAYALLVAQDLAPARRTPAELRAALEANIESGMVGGIRVQDLNTAAARETAYEALEAAGKVPPAPTSAEVAALIAAHSYADIYAEPDAAVTDAARAALDSVSTKVGLMQAADLGLDALSLASIYFLAAIGLAITFGVMGVINMAHGEFITMGAYTGYVVQLFVPDYTLSILIALPLAFAVTFSAGVAMERFVIRFLYRRPLETLLATFGISIALQQLFKNIFGTQARPLTAPSWLEGSWDLNDIVGISWIRIAIFVLALVFLALYLFVMKRTRLGLEVRAVTQNRAMAASMGINPDRINMLAFGLGSGIAGVAGVAIGLFAKVTSELGSDYIVQSFMTVVVGGVGSIWGTLAGATLIGFLQKSIEWLNPSNTLAAQTWMILFIIIFIQFRPRGIIALKGRAAGD